MTTTNRVTYVLPNRDRVVRLFDELPNFDEPVYVQDERYFAASVESDAHGKVVSLRWNRP